jgi:hypothetical protein
LAPSGDHHIQLNCALIFDPVARHLLHELKKYTRQYGFSAPGAQHGAWQC